MLQFGVFNVKTESWELCTAARHQTNALQFAGWQASRLGIQLPYLKANN